MVLDQQRKIFHESWYRLAGSKISLRASVRVHRQTYRGVLWYVLYEPFTNQYYRLPRGAYDFVSRLSPDKTVGEVWSAMLKGSEGEMPGQGEVIEMLAQLYQANMLMYTGVDDGAKLFERNRKQKQKKVKASLLNIFFLKVPLFDPDALLNKLRWLIRFLLSKPFALVWLATVIVAAKYGIENFDALKDQSSGFLSPSNIGWVYVCTVFVKLLHEFGHASVVKRYGGEVHTLGVMFMLLVPLPYVDATASWSRRGDDALGPEPGLEHGPEQGERGHRRARGDDPLYGKAARHHACGDPQGLRGEIRPGRHRRSQGNGQEGLSLSRITS